MARTLLPTNEPSDVEAATLQHLADGHTMDQIARAEHVARNSVSMRMRRMAARLGFPDATTAQLVAIGLRREWIS